MTGQARPAAGTGVARAATGRRIILGSALLAPFIRTARADPIKLRVSLDTAPDHGRTLSVADFLNKLQAASQGAIAPQLFDSGQLFADHDVIRGLVLNQVEMAVPGTWIVSVYVPEADLGQLPIFYGQPAAMTHRAVDGPIGEMVNEQISRKLRVQILGRWLDLGFTNWYSSRRPLTELAGLKGRKIRNAGGFAQSWRAEFFGGIAMIVAWPDVPLGLSQGTFDALQSTNASCASARLWSAGLRFALIDNQNMGSYIPMISATFWAALSPALKTLVTDLWAANIATYQTTMAAAQDRAEQELQARGVKIAVVPVEEVAEQRKRMLAEGDKIAQQMKISPEMLAHVNEAVTASD